MGAEVGGLSVAEIAAYIGAAAWIQPLVYFAISFFKRPRLRLIPSEKIAICYHESGPVLIQKAFMTSSTKEMIVDSIEILLRHEKGDVCRLKWDYYIETLSEIQDMTQGTKQEFRRNGEAIALKLNPSSSINQQFCFCNRMFRDAANEKIDKLKDRVQSLIKTRSIDWDNFSQIEEYRALESYLDNNFYWREGRYTVKFVFSSPQKFFDETGEYYFIVTSAMMQQLRSNMKILQNNVLANVNPSGLFSISQNIFPQVPLFRA
ncbi:hypothetical protein [Desulfocurvibacter africanus]|uniref:Uncharacterized protein n=1 Tax=Desulfocurvibacter africanus subsp. africanus str. Walvis Bay TaxID=690850 RepID=F3Z065_DESAF|nr:hypothetical protein [Desulfocurvibacter africanus]EGJ49767.1 hypothetical protein Desaf_1430 [Desulfocurvibacter africanus subsp. africanus str. Walvis Bay]